MENNALVAHMMPHISGILRQHDPLARRTSWRVGGVAELSYRPAHLSDLSVFLSHLPQDYPVTWLGLGSNVLIQDGGIPGVVICTLGGLSHIGLTQKHTIRAEAGVPCAKLSKWCLHTNQGKGAFFAGIPGTVGGALAMNAGAFGQCTWDYVTHVQTMDRQGVVRHRAPCDFQVGYRSVKLPGEEWFVAGYFGFPEEDPTKMRQEVRRLLKKRAQTQPIGQYSCGSVFRNPKGDHAAALIEQSGLKNTRRGHAIVSEKHANFILNTGNATAEDIALLIRYVQARVYEKTGKVLELECHILGNPL